MIDAIISLFVFMFGASVASFLNVVIWRVPRDESIISPPSHCPKCNAGIKWYQNIPILSWLALRGKCANCGLPISPRYLLIELLGGGLFLAAYAFFNPFLPFFEPLVLVKLITLWIWISLMIVGSAIDFDLQLLPDFVTVGGMALGVSSAVVKSVVYGVERGAWDLGTFCPLLYSLGGLALGFGLLALIRSVGTLAFKREAMGLGDVFLMGAIGAICGPVSVLVTLVLSAIAGSLVGVALILLSKARLGSFVEIPYGPYLCLGCLVWIFYGPELVNWYCNLIRIS